jgi:hypothetical protein
VGNPNDRVRGECTFTLLLLQEGFVHGTHGDAPFHAYVRMCVDLSGKGRIVYDCKGSLKGAFYRKFCVEEIYRTSYETM